MVTKVVINNNGDTPIEYLSGLGAFKNGKTYEFKPGVNIIVGKNGCGKTTLMNLKCSRHHVAGELLGYHRENQFKDETN